VVDFTQQSDAEILAYLARAAGAPTCGRFAAGQLERPLQRAALAAPRRWRAWLAAAVAVWGLREAAGSEARAQTPTEQHERPATSPNNFAAKPDYEGVAQQLVLSGVVFDSQSGEVLPGVSVILNGTDIATATNAKGEFRLAVAYESSRDGFLPARVLFQYLGYVTQEWRVAELSSQPARIALQTDVKGLMEIAVLPPVPWKPRAFYHWGKYWLTRPFQRR
jgi:hypothetical protein